MRGHRPHHPHQGASGPRSGRTVPTILPLTNGVTAGLVQVCVQELQHQCPLLTSRIQEGAFTPMEVPTLPIHTPGDTTDTGEHEQWWHGY